MSGGDSWASTEPSANSTNEWTIDSGWTITSICSARRPNSQRASITSRALFISVAESTVIFGPICQVGCCSASLGGDVFQFGRASAAERAAAGGQHDAVDLVAACPAAAPGRWRECSLSTGSSCAPRSRGQLHDQRAGDDERFLVGEGDGLAGFEGRPGAVRARRADDRRHDDIDVRIGDHGREAVVAAEQPRSCGQAHLPGGGRRPRRSR